MSLHMLFPSLCFYACCFQFVSSIRLRSQDDCIIHGIGDTQDKSSWTGESTVWGDSVWSRTVSPENERELETIILGTPVGSSLIVGGTNSALGWAMHPATPYSTLVSMWKFKKFWIDVCEKTITVQAGVTYLDIGPALADKGLVVPFYYMFKRFTLIGTMSSGSSPLTTGQVRSPADFVTSMKVMNGQGVVSVIDVETDKIRAAAWLNSIGDLGVVLEATFNLEKDHNLQSSCKEIAGIDAALKNHDDYGETNMDISVSDPGCNETQMVRVCEWSRVGTGNKKNLDLGPIANLDEVTIPLRTLETGKFEPLQCTAPSSLIHRTALLDKSSKDDIVTRSVTTDMLTDVPWQVPLNLPEITTIFVPKDDIEVTLAAIEELREQDDLSFRLNVVTVHNYPGSISPILLSHKDSHKDSFMIYLLSFNFGAFPKWVSRLLHRLICKHKISVGYKLANNYPREWIGAQESNFPSLEGLTKFREISMLEDPFDRFSNVLAQELFKRLEGAGARLC